MGMIIGRSRTPLKSSKTLRAVRRRETVRRSDENSPLKVQNVRGQLRIQVGFFVMTRPVARPAPPTGASPLEP
jgi:hypothetical protein